MVKAGYAKSLEEAKQMSARDVIQAIHYESFIQDYDHAIAEMNQEKP